MVGDEHDRRLFEGRDGDDGGRGDLSCNTSEEIAEDQVFERDLLGIELLERVGIEGSYTVRRHVDRHAGTVLDHANGIELVFRSV